jgi:hypothetical protein
MGAWGHKTFENDDASDWLYELEESSDLSVIESALTFEGYIEAPDGCNALAAAEILLALAGKPHSKLPENAAACVAEHSHLNSTKLFPVAAASLTQVLSDNSELKELWQET